MMMCRNYDVYDLVLAADLPKDSGLTLFKKGYFKVSGGALRVCAANNDFACSCGRALARVACNMLVTCL